MQEPALSLSKGSLDPAPYRGRGRLFAGETVWCAPRVSSCVAGMAIPMIDSERSIAGPSLCPVSFVVFSRRITGRWNLRDCGAPEGRWKHPPLDGPEQQNPTDDQYIPNDDYSHVDGDCAHDDQGYPYDEYQEVGGFYHATLLLSVVAPCPSMTPAASCLARDGLLRVPLTPARRSPRLPYGR